MPVDVTTAQRLRYDGVETYLATQLDPGVTTISFTTPLKADGGALIDTLVGTQYLPLTLLDVNYRLLEIVYLTAYVSGDTVGTIERGAEGTSDVTHSAGNKIVHAATVMDYLLVQDHDTDSSAHPEILAAAVAYTDGEITDHEQPEVDSHPAYVKKAGDTITGDLTLAGTGTTHTVEGTLRIAAGATLSVEGDLRVTGRFFLNGREVIASNTPPSSPSANTIYIQTFG
jgi:hypothetical protein